MNKNICINHCSLAIGDECCKGCPNSNREDLEVDLDEEGIDWSAMPDAQAHWLTQNVVLA